MHRCTQAHLSNGYCPLTIKAWPTRWQLWHDNV